MAVTREQLAQYIQELDLPSDQSDALVNTLLANDTAAQRFVGQRLRHDDYTRKTQALSEQEKSIQAQYANSLAQYAAQLDGAQAKINGIMSDLEKSKISEATANARLLKVKTTYNLSDEDIPKVEVPNPAGTASPSQPVFDKNALLNEMRGTLLKELRNDLIATPQLAAIYADINEEHKELTGKRLAQKDIQALVEEATKQNKSLISMWEEKHNIGDLRQKAHDEKILKDARAKWEDDQRKANSEAALNGVRNRATVDSTASMSPVVGRKYRDRSDESANFSKPPSPSTPAQTPASNGAPDKSPSSTLDQPKLSGAERAMARFIERRQSGVPMGAPIQPPAQK